LVFVESLFYVLYVYCTDDWSREDFPYRRLDHGKWELTIPPNADGSCRIPHNSTLKVYHVTT